MGYYCTVPQCTSLAGKTKNVKFHRFPRDDIMAEKWNNILKRGKPFTKYSKVCSLHFTPTDYNITTMGQWKTLSKDAIPTQNLPKLNPDGTVMVIRKSRTVKYKECKKDDLSVKTEKFTNIAPIQSQMSEAVKQEQPDSCLSYRHQTSLPPDVPPKPGKQDAIMQTDPIQSEDEQTSELEYTFDVNYDLPKDFSKQTEDFIPTTNEEYNKEAEKYALQRKNHTPYQKTDYQKTDYQKTDYQKTDYQKTDYQKTAADANYAKTEVYNGFRDDYDFIYQNPYPDSVGMLRNKQHNLEVLQQQHRINENQNFFIENHIKQENDFTNEQQIDQSMYEQTEQQRILEHNAQVKQEPDAAVCENVMQPQTSPYYPTEGAHNVTSPYYRRSALPGPELLIAKQNALAAQSQLWPNEMKKPFFYSDSTHYNSTQILHRYNIEDFSKMIQ